MDLLLYWFTIGWFGCYVFLFHVCLCYYFVCISVGPGMVRFVSGISGHRLVFPLFMIITQMFMVSPHIHIDLLYDQHTITYSSVSYITVRIVGLFYCICLPLPQVFVSSSRDTSLRIWNLDLVPPEIISSNICCE